MQQVSNPVANIYQTQLEASRRFADAVFSGTERLDRTLIEATHQAITDQLNFAQAIASGSDLRTAAPNLASGFFQSKSDGTANYQAEIIRIFAEMQAEIGKSMQQYMEHIGTQAASVPTQAVQSVQQASSDTQYNPMTSMFSVWESAFREATSMAAKSMEAARANAERAMDTAGNFTRSASRSTESAAEHAGGYARSTTRAAEGATEGAAEATRKAASEAEEGKGTRRR